MPTPAGNAKLTLTPGRGVRVGEGGGLVAMGLAAVPRKAIGWAKAGLVLT